MIIKYNQENAKIVSDLVLKQADLIRTQDLVISRQDAIIGSLSNMLGDVQRYGYTKMEIPRMTQRIASLEEALTEVE